MGMCSKHTTDKVFSSICVCVCVLWNKVEVVLYVLQCIWFRMVGPGNLWLKEYIYMLMGNLLCLTFVLVSYLPNIFWKPKKRKKAMDNSGRWLWLYMHAQYNHFCCFSIAEHEKISHTILYSSCALPHSLRWTNLLYPVFWINILIINCFRQYLYCGSYSNLLFFFDVWSINVTLNCSYLALWTNTFK